MSDDRAPKVMIGTPSFEGRPCIEYVQSMISTAHLLCERQIPYMVYTHPGDALLAKARSCIASSLLTDYPECTDLFFIDDDIGFPPEKFFEFLNHEEGVVCGVYPRKLDTRAWTASLFIRNGSMVKKQNGLVLGGRVIPAGFMRIRRHVIERMAEAAPWHMEPQPNSNALPKQVWNMFHAGHIDPEIEKLRTTDLSTLTHEETTTWLKRAIGVVTQHGGTYFSEDAFFAHRWRQMGGSCWIDPDIGFTHRGSKAWGGRFADCIKDVPVQIDEGEWDDERRN